jgi:transcriptional regulator with XRE-family HTH domain
VRWVRYSTKLKSLKQRLLEAGMLTGKQIAARLGVRRTTIGRWRREGRLEARICNDQGEWLYHLPQELSNLTTRLPATAERLAPRTDPLQEVQYEE